MVNEELSLFISALRATIYTFEELAVHVNRNKKTRNQTGVEAVRPIFKERVSNIQIVDYTKRFNLHYILASKRTSDKGPRS